MRPCFPLEVRLPFVLLMLALPLLSGCVGAGIYAGVEASSVAVFGRGVGDIGVSAITGKDCSIVRLDRGQNYCAPKEQLPAPQPYCTQTLGTVNCWSNPEAFALPPHKLADTPPLTPDQVKSIDARWPKSLNIAD